MKYASAIMFSMLSILLGFALIQYLTCHPAYISVFLVLVCASGLLLATLLYRGFKAGDSLFLCLLLCLCMFAISYLGNLHLFMQKTEQIQLPEITRLKGDKGLGHTAIILLAHGEPKTYDALPWIKQMKEFDQQKIPFIPYPFRPFFFHSLREKYLIAGKSEHNQECLQVMQQMEAEYRDRGDRTTKFYISYLESNPRPDAAVIQALNDGASRIILCNMFVTISSHTQEAIHLIAPLKLEQYGVGIQYTKPLYDSAGLQQLYIDEVMKSVESTDKASVGIILVGHGQPVEWDQEFGTQTEQEISFRKDVLTLFEKQGYSPHNLKLAWMEFRDPKPKDALSELVNNGVTDIFFFSTILGSESLHAKYDVPALMHQVKLPDSVRLQQLTAFRDKKGLVKALMERIEALK